MLTDLSTEHTYWPLANDFLLPFVDTHDTQRLNQPLPVPKPSGNILSRMFLHLSGDQSVDSDTTSLETEAYTLSN